MSSLSRALLGATALAFVLPPPALAQGQPQGQPSSVQVPQLNVQAPPAGSLTQPGVAEQRRELEQAPSAVRLVPSEEFQNRYAFSIRDTLVNTPGVFADTRYGQEMRLSVRGSGLARGFHLRGVELLQDGTPLNLADGSGDMYAVDPLALRSVEVLPGGNALRFGSSTLGGAINFISPTAHTAIAPNIIRVEAGSYGTWRLNGQVSRVFGDADALANFTTVQSDGRRTHSRTSYQQFNANVGYRISPDIETRFYVGAYDVRQQLPGSLTLQQALQTPLRANAAAISAGVGGNQARNQQHERFANRTTVNTAYGQFSLDAWVTHKNLYHPIFQVLDQDGYTWGMAPRFTTNFTVAGMRNELILGARYFAGTNAARQFVNVGGSPFQQTLNARQNAQNYQAYLENRLWVLPTLAVVAGVKALHDERDYRDYGGGLSASRGAASYSRTYEGLNPKIGLLWQPRPNIQFFTNLTRSVDVPDFTDLLQTSVTTTAFAALQSQRAWTGEIGTRGRYDGFSWDLTLFRSNIQGQLLQFTTAAGLGTSATVNAGNTVNQGVEFAGRVRLARNITAPDAGDSLTLGQVWTFNDFRFRNDRQYGNNQVAGLPPHVLRTTLSYTRPSGLFVTPALDWVPQGAWADYANTLRANSHIKIGFEAGMQVAQGVTLFVDARNLANKRYISDLGTITDSRRVSSAVFYPGEGRSVYAGARIAF